MTETFEGQSETRCVNLVSQYVRHFFALMARTICLIYQKL